LDDKFAEIDLQDFTPMEHPVHGESDLILDELSVFGIIELLDLLGRQDTDDRVS
jgi:hypothetical protein